MQALDQARLEHDDSTQAMVLTALGVVALVAGQATEALERLESSAAKSAAGAPLRCSRARQHRLDQLWLRPASAAPRTGGAIREHRARGVARK